MSQVCDCVHCRWSLTCKITESATSCMHSLSLRDVLVVLESHRWHESGEALIARIDDALKAKKP
jgi:hypothetical protein